MFLTQKIVIFFFQQPYSFGAFCWALELTRQSQLWESHVSSQLCVSFSCTGPKLWHFASVAMPFISERGGIWCETEPHTPAWAVHGYHGSWQRWGHFPLTLRNKVKLKRQFCAFWGCCAPAPCRRKARDVVLIFQCAGGSGMFWALLEREQMLHNCNRKSRMLLYITDFPQCFGKDRWPKQMWKRVELWSMSASWIFKIWSTVWQKHRHSGFCLAGFYIYPWLPASVYKHSTHFHVVSKCGLN